MAAPRGYKQCRPNPVSGVHVNRSRPLAPRTRALVHGLCSPLDEVYRQLRRKPHQGAVLATLVVAEAQLSVAAPTEKDQTIAVFAEGHEWSGDSEADTRSLIRRNSLGDGLVNPSLSLVGRRIAVQESAFGITGSAASPRLLGPVNQSASHCCWPWWSWQTKSMITALAKITTSSSPSAMSTP